MRINSGSNMSVKNCRGFSIVETLVAIALVAITMAGTASLIANSMLGNSSVRKHANLVNDIRSRVDNYRQQSFTTLLAAIGSPASSITNGQSVTINSSSTSPNLTYVTTLTAIKNNATGVPQAVRIRIDALQGRGRFKTANYSFETLVANVS